MIQVTQPNGGAAVARRARPARKTMFDLLLQSGFPELSLASGLLNAVAPTLSEGTSFIPPVEVSEKDGSYSVDVALPGFKKDDIEIEVSGNEITISGTYTRKRDDAKTQYSEMQQGAFTRTIVLPHELDADKVSASFDDGILHIAAPPIAPLTAKKVPVVSSQETNKT